MAVKRTVALTGATGFIGSALARQLCGAGWHVKALARPESNVACLSNLDIELITGSVGDLDRLKLLVADAYAVVHCAGAVRGLKPTEFDEVNVEGTANLVNALEEQNPSPRLLAISSLAAREPNLSPYAASKRRGEDAVRRLGQRMEWVILRPPAVYGPGDREMLFLFRSMAQGVGLILGPKTAHFSLIYVEDLVMAIQRWLEQGNCENGVYELHDGQPGGYSWDDVVEATQALCGRRILRIRIPRLALQLLAVVSMATAYLLGYAPMLTLGKVRELRHTNWVCENAKLRQATGWSPQVRFTQGLRCTLDGV